MSKRCTLLWREAHSEFNMYKTHHARTTFRSWDVKKSARLCGAKHIYKSKCTKHTILGTLLEVEMSKAYFQVKSARKNWRVRSTFGRSDVVSCGRRKGLCTLSKVSKTWGFCSSFSNNHHYTTLHSTTLQLQQHYTTLITLYYTALITLHYTTLDQTRLHYSTRHCSTLHYTTSDCTTRIAPHHSYDCNCTTPITLHYNYNYSCTSPHYIQQLWMRWPLQPLQKHNSNHLSVHQWIGSATHASQQLTSPIVSYLWNFRHRLVPYYWIHTYIYTHTYIYIYIILYILYICISYFTIHFQEVKRTMLLKTQMTPSAEAKSLERVFNRLLPSVPFAVQSHWEKCKTMFLAMPSRRGRCHAWNVAGRSLQCKTWPKWKNIAGTQPVEKDNISLNQSRDTWL